MTSLEGYYSQTNGISFCILLKRYYLGDRPSRARAERSFGDAAPRHDRSADPSDGQCQVGTFLNLFSFIFIISCLFQFGD